VLRPSVLKEAEIERAVQILACNHEHIPILQHEAQELRTESNGVEVPLEIHHEVVQLSHVHDEAPHETAISKDLAGLGHHEASVHHPLPSVAQDTVIGHEPHDVMPADVHSASLSMCTLVRGNTSGH